MTRELVPVLHANPETNLSEFTFHSSSEKILPIATGYPERFHVPPGMRPWSRPFEGYQPVFFEATRVLEMDRTRTPEGWADPADISREEFTLMKKTGALTSYEGTVQLDAETGRPLNPAGRTGIEGRGLLGKWGANQAADALLTRINAETGELEVLLIQRDCGGWAIPGGMLDSGEDALTAAKRELEEETGIEGLAAPARLIFQGMGEGPRTTDNAWIETTLYHFHLDANDPAACSPLIPGSDVQDAQWTAVNGDLMVALYANHGEMLAMALSQFRFSTERLSNLVLEQLEQIPHARTLTSFSQLHGRVGILGGTFDPVQVGHVFAARAAQQAHQLDAVVFVPAAQNPIKQSTPGAVARERVDMVSRAIEGNRRLFVSPLETRKGGVSFTIDTIRAIREQLPPDSELFFIIGSDCIPHLPKWHQIEQLKTLVTFIPIDRAGATTLDSQKLATTLGADFAAQLERNTVEGLGIDVSSTEIRAALARGAGADGCLPPRVLEYIRERHLYGSGWKEFASS